MEFKHSPAPWAVDDNGIFFEITREDGLRVGDVCSSQHLYDDSKHHGNGVAYANACLIAAAPELLEALQSIQQSMAKYIEVANNIGVEALADGFYLGHAIDVEEKARQAIAKALGQQ